MVTATELHTSSGKELLSANQLVRWVMTKEEHADKIIRLVSEYCLCQRVKPEAFADKPEEYNQALRSHHAVMIAAMKSKQSLDIAACDHLDHVIADMAKMYTK